MKQFIEAPVSFRYETMGNNSAKHLLIVLHGYGQLAEFFIQKFTDFKDDFFIVAPEGMHRFYLKGSSGRVGASWMTTEERMLDISTNINWLTKLLDQLMHQHDYEKISVLGFSQGGATAARWYYSTNKINYFISWASVFPPDLQNEETGHSKQNNNFFVIGDSDEYCSTEEQKELLKFYESKGYKTLVFEGNHRIDTPSLKKILDEIK